MYIDEQGKKWFKGNLHTHTTVSDGRLSPAAAAELYRTNGYDFLALTDHWNLSHTKEEEGLLLLSGCEYNFHTNVRDGIYHIVGVGMQTDPAVRRNDTPQTAISKIHAAGGLAILAHPAWSLNTPEQLLSLPGLDATEIFNSVSDLPYNCRPYSGLIIDMLAARGYILPLTAADDTHFYEKADTCRSYIMVQADECSPQAILSAVRCGKLYATQGPQLHAEACGRRIYVRCSPASAIVFFTDSVWVNHRAEVGTSLTEAVYDAAPGDSFVRVEITDRDGKSAWSGCIPLCPQPVQTN